MDQPTAPQETPSYNPMVPAVDQAVRLLLCLEKNSNAAMTLTQICREIDIHKSKGFSILHTLMQYQFITKDPVTKTYTIGPGLMKVARNANENTDIQKIACPYLKFLVSETKCTVILGTINMDRLYILSRFESQEPIGVTIRQFQTLHITHGAHGKAIAAFSSPDEKKRLMTLTPLRFYGENTPFNKDLLEKELSDCRKTGYAVDDGHTTPGIRALSSPVFDHQQKIIAAVILLGTFSKKQIKIYGEKLANSARLISKDLGGHFN